MRWSALLLAALVACDGESDTVESESEVVDPCEWDGPAPAVDLSNGIPAQAYICPAGDEDSFVFEPSGEEILQLTIRMDQPGSAPLTLTYGIWSGEDLVATAPVGAYAQPGAPLEVLHKAPEGPVRIEVRELGDDGWDDRNPYTVQLAALPERDDHEPNDIQAAATAANPTLRGRLSYLGDQDWYAIDAEPGDVLAVALSADATAIRPTVAIHDQAGLVLWSGELPDALGVTSISRSVPVPEGGVWARVFDPTGYQANPNVEYTLVLAPGADADVYEPNNVPAVAADLGVRSCGPEWSAVATADARIGSSGDVDWYRLALDQCDGGLFEAQLQFTSPEAMAPGLEGEIRMLRPVDGATCTVDQDCALLPIDCSHDLDCAGYGSVCRPEGQCAGAVACLPQGECGANVQVAQAELVTPGTAVLSAPLQGIDELFLGVSDQRGDAFDPDATYALHAQVRLDPDPFEPSGIYTGGPPTTVNAGRHSDSAVELPVYDCTLGDCCDDSTWTEGAIGYAWDQDWYRYQHPCPGQDCMVRVHYELDEGPVDQLLQVYRGEDLWFDTLAGTVERDWHTARAGWYGGLGAADSCFYAFQDHGGNDFWYHLVVRDTRYVSAQYPQAGTWEWDPDQSFRVCVEKVADGCLSPCQLTNGECGP